jgi:hypothetical protein
MKIKMNSMSVRLSSLSDQIVVFTIKCNKDLFSVIPPDTTVVKKDTTEDVYVFGATQTQAGYWKNSQFIPLATGKNGNSKASLRFTRLGMMGIPDGFSGLIKS